MSRWLLFFDDTSKFKFSQFYLKVIIIIPVQEINQYNDNDILYLPSLCPFMRQKSALNTLFSINLRNKLHFIAKVIFLE